MADNIGTGRDTQRMEAVPGHEGPQGTRRGTTAGKAPGAAPGATPGAAPGVDGSTGFAAPAAPTAPGAPTAPAAPATSTGHAGSAGSATSATSTGHAGPTESVAKARATAAATGSHRASLLPHQECDKYTERLHHTVSGFVDGPRDAVEDADRVLEEIASRFTEAVAERRRTLRTSWQGGTEGGPSTGDTEQLRLALRDYRELAERLLKV
ncbi:hypothetical protein [Streptomyces sp. CRN 30]|uniref:hypothetical protein n=1 Tax=Streptomyces sp. CRN 30 TaxID=3075613 RepID=UPI002A7FC350|nr:hypothetical protein [Streptomyces sp. CRN 30]